MAIKFRFNRGLEANLPAEGALGEPFYTTDTNKLFLGNGTGQPLSEFKSGESSGDSGSGVAVVERYTSYTVDDSETFVPEMLDSNGIDGYSAVATSSTYNWGITCDAWRAFNRIYDASQNGWVILNGTPYDGNEYLTLTCPEPTIVGAFKYATRNDQGQGITGIRIEGSNDNVNWTNIGDFQDLSLTAFDSDSFLTDVITTDSKEAFTYFKVTPIQGGKVSEIYLTELELFKTNIVETSIGMPENPSENQIIFNKTTGSFEIYNGSEWTTIAASEEPSGEPGYISVADDSEYPEEPELNQVIYNIAESCFKTYNGTSWLTVNDFELDGDPISVAERQDGVATSYVDEYIIPEFPIIGDNYSASQDGYSIVCSHSSYSNYGYYGVCKLFNRIVGERWRVDYSASSEDYVDLDISLPASEAVGKIALILSTITDFEFFGSNNETSWESLGSSDDAVFYRSTVNNDLNLYHNVSLEIGNTSAYKYYKLRITGASKTNIEMAELLMLRPNMDSVASATILPAIPHTNQMIYDTVSKTFKLYQNSQWNTATKNASEKEIPVIHVGQPCELEYENDPYTDGYTISGNCSLMDYAIQNDETNFCTLRNNQYIIVDYLSPVNICKLTVRSGTYNYSLKNSALKNFRIDGSNDGGNTWETITTIEQDTPPVDITVAKEFTFNNLNEYSSYKITVLEAYNSTGYTNIRDLKLYRSVALPGAITEPAGVDANIDDIIFDSTNKIFKYYDGTAWKDASAEPATKFTLDTTDDTPVILGSIKISAGNTSMLNIDAVAKDATGQSALWNIKACAKNDGTSAVIVGAPVITEIAKEVAAWNVNLAVNGDNIDIVATGDASNTTSFKATTKSEEV